MEVMRLLWTRTSVDYDGRFHRLQSVGIQFAPVQRPIPVWMGGVSAHALERAGRLADGVILPGKVLPDETYKTYLAMARAAAVAARRERPLGVEASIRVGTLDDGQIRDLAMAWRRAGATHLCVDTRYAGYTTPSEHLRAIRRAAALVL